MGSCIIHKKYEELNLKRNVVKQSVFVISEIFFSRFHMVTYGKFFIDGKKVILSGIINIFRPILILTQLKQISE
jgi:hypothetical protein